MKNSKLEDVRFSKAAVLERVDFLIKRIRDTWKFDENNGTSQLRRIHPKQYQDACLAYGQLMILKFLREDLQ